MRGRRGHSPPVAVCKGRHVGLNIPEIHEAVHSGMYVAKFESWHSNLGMYLVKCPRIVISIILNMIVLISIT